MLLKISLAVVGVSFLLALIFLSFLYVKLYLEDKYNISEYKIFKSRLKRDLKEISCLSGNEFPIVRDVCEYLSDRAENNFSDNLTPGEFYMGLSMKYGDDGK